MADDLHERQVTMQRDALLVATATFSLINGQSFSPLFDPVLYLIRPFIAQIIASPILLYYFTSLFISIMTLLIAGVPAALYERIRGHHESTPISIGIWLATTILLSLPTIVSWVEGR